MGQPAFDEYALLAFAARHGLTVVQLADNLPIHTWPAERVERFTRAAHAARISIELGARGLNDAHLVEYLNLCRQCNARLLRFVADADRYEPSADDLTAIIRNAGHALASAGVTLALENHDRFPAAVMRRIIDRAATLVGRHLPGYGELTWCGRGAGRSRRTSSRPSPSTCT